MMIDRLRDAKRVEVSYSNDRAAATLATSAWLRARGLDVRGVPRWNVAIALDVVNRSAVKEFDPATDTRFHISISPNEWGFFFCHQARASWIRVTDVPSVFERDDHGLLANVPPLRDLGTLVHDLEELHHIQFRRIHASIFSSIPDSEPTIRLWVAASI